MAIRHLAHERAARGLRTSNRVSTKLHLSLALLFNLYERTSIESKSSITDYGLNSERP